MFHQYHCVQKAANSWRETAKEFNGMHTSDPKLCSKLLTNCLEKKPAKVTRVTKGVPWGEADSGNVLFNSVFERKSIRSRSWIKELASPLVPQEAEDRLESREGVDICCFCLLSIDLGASQFSFRASLFPSFWTLWFRHDGLGINFRAGRRSKAWPLWLVQGWCNWPWA